MPWWWIFCRPYFTYWATFVQIVIYIVAVSVYGTAPFGVGKHTEQKMVRMGVSCVDVCVFSVLFCVHICP